MLYFRYLMLSERFSPELTDDHFVKRKKMDIDLISF